MFLRYNSNMREKVKEEEKVVEQEEWDNTRIIIGGIVFLLLIIGGFLGKNYILDYFGIKDQPVAFHQGAQTVNVSPGESATVPHVQYSLPSTADVTNKIHDLQQQVSHINIAEVASSSPEIQQLIQQLESLPQMPGNAAKQACINVCNKL